MHALSVHFVIWVTVSRPRIFIGTSSRKSIDFGVFRQDVLEHGAGLAGFHVDDHLFVHFIFIHVGKSILELIGEKVASYWHGDKTWSSVVGEIKEDPGVAIRIEDFVTGCD